MAFLLLPVAVIIVYYNSLNGELVFDDAHVTQRTNLHLSSLDFDALKGTLFLTPQQKKIYRPIPCLTLGINYFLSGENTKGYHIVNITIHILCALMVYIFLLTVLSIPGVKPQFAATYRHEIALIAACFFALHPLQTNVASYIIQRMTSMAALFYIISVTGYLKFRLGLLNRQRRSAVKTYIFLVICLVSALLAILSKENTAFLPFVLLAIEFFFFYPTADPETKKRLIRIYGIVLFFIFAAIAYKGPKYFFQSLADYKMRDFTIVERLLTESRIVFYYLYLIFFPNQNELNLNHDFPVSTGLISPPQTLLSILSLGLAIIFLIKLRKKYNIFAFIIAWYFGNLLIESSFIPLELVYEHRTYLPGVVIYLLMALFIVYLSKTLGKAYIMVLLTALILIVYGHGTFLRNVVYSNNLSMWLDVVEKSPGLSRAHSNLADAYWARGKIDEAKSSWEKALELKPDMYEATVNLAVLHLSKYNDLETALKYAKKSFRHRDRDQFGPKVLGDIYWIKKKYPKAVHFYRLALKRGDFYSEARNGLGLALINMGQGESGVAQFKAGIKMDPSFENFYLNLAVAYKKENRIAEAIEVLESYPKRFGEPKKIKILKDKFKKLDGERKQM